LNTVVTQEQTLKKQFIRVKCSLVSKIILNLAGEDSITAYTVNTYFNTNICYFECSSKW